MNRQVSIAAATALALAAAGCAAPRAEGELIADPMEAWNRDIHSFNKGVDTVLIQPATTLYDFVAPQFVQDMVSNELDFLSLPAIFVNRLLQGDLEKAGEALGRLTVNATLGVGGLFDTAADHFNLPHDPTDFGVTLAVWGAEEGIYHEAPLLGPSTTRHLVGRVVNFALDPTILLTTGVVEAGATISAINSARTPAGIIVTRDENGELIDDILYESDDSYVASRTGYVQFRRRFVAGGETDTEELPDIFSN